MATNTSLARRELQTCQDSEGSALLDRTNSTNSTNSTMASERNTSNYSPTELHNLTSDHQQTTVDTDLAKMSYENVGGKQHSRNDETKLRNYETSQTVSTHNAYSNPSASKHAEASQSHPTNSDSYCSEMTTCINVGAFAILGCLIRVGIDTGVGSKGLKIEGGNNVIFGSFMSNIFGSMVLGCLTGSSLKEMNGMLPVYTGISTGLCGSITTFSAFMQQMSLMIIGEANPIGNNYYSAFLSIILGLAAPMAAYVVGLDISKKIREMLNRNGSSQPVDPRKSAKIAKGLNIFFAFAFVAAWVTFLALSVVYNCGYIFLYAVFAPFGANLRYILGKLNKKQYSSKFINNMQIGTFAANFIGAVILSFCHIILTWAGLACPGITAIKAVGTGFCACLTTVSTFISEIHGKRKKGDITYSHLYPFFTIVISLIFMCTINGVSFAVSNNS